ncbi:hypothetical protein V6N13_032917 [Hibiscus sabdariffa]
MLWMFYPSTTGLNGTATGPLLQYEWLIGSQYKPVELAKSDWVAIRKAPPWAIDSWGLGCLIYEIFSGMKLGETEELRDTSSIPKPLLPDYQRLLSSLPSRRLNTSKLIDNSEFFQNKLVDTVHFMEILSLKDSVERDTFFRKLPTLAEQLCCQIVLNKIFPLLTSALEYGSAAAHALNALLKTGNREIVGLRTKKQQLTCNREMRQTWNEEATIHICDENTIHSYFWGKKAPYTGVVVLDGGQHNDSTFLAYQSKEESDNIHHALLCRSDNNSLLYHHRLHYKDKDEWLIAVEASQTVYSYFDDMRVKWRPSKRLSRFAQRIYMMQIITMPFGHTGDYTIYQENYNLSRDLKSFLFHATDKNLAYVSPRFLLVYQSFVVDASERSKFIVNLECPGDIIRFCNNAFRHCNDHLRNIGILGHHKKDIESRLSIAFPSLYLGLFEALLKYAKDLK